MLIQTKTTNVFSVFYEDFDLCLYKMVRKMGNSEIHNVTKPAFPLSWGAPKICFMARQKSWYGYKIKFCCRYIANLSGLWRAILKTITSAVFNCRKNSIEKIIF